MALIFYPHEDELASSTLEQRLEVLLESAERYKAVMLDASKTSVAPAAEKEKDKGRGSPRDISHAYNWEEIAKLLRDIRELPEAAQSSKVAKAAKLKKLAEIYEVLRGAKMAKLEAVRIALMNEANQLLGSAQQVA